MNVGVLYTTPGEFYALPEAGQVGPNGENLNILRQPIIGEVGYNPRKRPLRVGAGTYDVTFELNVLVPAGYNLEYSPHVIVSGVMGVPEGGSPNDAATLSFNGTDLFSYSYSHPQDPESRLARKIRTLTAVSEYESALQPSYRNVQIVVHPGYVLTFMRCAYLVRGPDV